MLLPDERVGGRREQRRSPWPDAGMKTVVDALDEVAKETGKTDDGRELPLFKLDTSSESHPFYTGTQKSVDSMGGRVEKFRNRFARKPA